MIQRRAPFALPFFTFPTDWLTKSMQYCRQSCYRSTQSAESAHLFVGHCAAAYACDQEMRRIPRMAGCKSDKRKNDKFPSNAKTHASEYVFFLFSSRPHADHPPFVFWNRSASSSTRVRKLRVPVTRSASHIQFARPAKKKKIISCLLKMPSNLVYLFVVVMHSFVDFVLWIECGSGVSEYSAFHLLMFCFAHSTESVMLLKCHAFASLSLFASAWRDVCLCTYSTECGGACFCRAYIHTHT